MKKFFENLVYVLVKSFGFFVQLLPIHVALWVGRVIGLFVYYFDVRHKSLAYGNLKTAFAKTKTPNELKQINKQLFKNFGQNLIELLRLPLMTPEKFDEYVEMKGRDNLSTLLKDGKGVILLAMHFGSWELASVSCAMFDHPYKVVVKPQKRFTKLDDLLNNYRSCGDNVVISRGLGTRELLKSIKNNEVVGMVVDQGGKDGVLVPLFGRQASLSVGAIRMGLKLGVPVCFSVIVRKGGPYHQMTINKPLELINTGNLDEDIITNLSRVTKIMESYIEQYPSEYMWFYKIWKYSKEATIAVMSDGKVGHLRQSQKVAQMIQEALAERSIKSKIEVLEVRFKSPFAARLMSILSSVVNSFIYQGRLEVLKLFLTKESFEQIMSVKTDFIVSCGSSVAGINCLLANDQGAKSVAILKPGLLSFRRFDLVVLPEHDRPKSGKHNGRVVITKGAANLIDNDYLREQSTLLLNRYSHLKSSQRMRIGLLIGGNSKNHVFNDNDLKMVINQIKEVSKHLNAEILVTTSRRTPGPVEGLLQRELKKESSLFISAAKSNIPEAVGGILGVADIVIVSGDSISMISEAASSGKHTIVFSIDKQSALFSKNTKHERFIESLNVQGHIISTDAKNLGQAIFNVAKNKIRTQKLDDTETILEAVRRII